MQTRDFTSGIKLLVHHLHWSISALAPLCTSTDASIKPFLRSTLTTTTTMRPAASPDPAYGRSGGAGGHGQQTLFVKVYMEGVPIGRKLDLLLLDGYDGLLAILGRMFNASIIHPDTVGHDHQVVLGEKKARHVVTYQDKEGDWLMAGDVPWELFLAAGVKKLKIARAD